MVLNPTDIHTAIASFIGVMVAEVVVKPIAIRTGRYLIRQADKSLNDVLPDWLWDTTKRTEDS